MHAGDNRRESGCDNVGNRFYSRRRVGGVKMNTEENGNLEGIDWGDYIEYRGVLYAKPPVGELRWKTPQEPEPWEGVLQAVDYRNKCVQESFLSPPYDKDFYSNPDFDRPMNEDCLLAYP
ncbi:para-nitrobenzyl esterase [Lachnospiraceae bacterium]|nr:para-nitrobenzyl esterase [Lachnospiraceae bacterium]